MAKEGLPLDNHKDCGCLLYDTNSQNVQAGGSGAGCSAAVLCGKILPMLAAGQLRRVLFLATGALMSQTTFCRGRASRASPTVSSWEVRYELRLGVCGRRRDLRRRAAFIDYTKLSPARILTGYVVAGVILSAVGLYKPLADFAGAGASVPLLGFGHLLAQGVQNAVDECGLPGAFTGGLTAASGGIAASLIFGVLAALVGKSKDQN